MNTVLMNVTFQVMNNERGRVIPGALLKEVYWKAIDVDSLEESKDLIENFSKEHGMVKDGN